MDWERGCGGDQDPALEESSMPTGMAEHQSKVQGRTSALLRRLLEARDLADFVEGHAHELKLPPFHAYITELCQAAGQVPEQVIRRADIERTYGHQLFNGRRKPSRDKVLQLAFGLQLDIEGTQRLLQIAQKSALYPKIKRDAASLYCLQYRQDILEAQSVLQSPRLIQLGEQANPLPPPQINVCAQSARPIDHSAWCDLGVPIGC
jgi:hypothetical protein